MLSFKVDLQGDREVSRALDGVKEGVKNRVIKAAAAKQARKAAKAAKALAPRATGTLARALGTKYKAYRGRLVWVYVIGPRRGMGRVVKGMYHDPVKYAHLAEWGRNAVRPTRAKALLLSPVGPVFRKAVKAAPGKPFMRPAWDGLKTSAASEMKADILEGIEREARKYAARGKSIYRR